MMKSFRFVEEPNDDDLVFGVVYPVYKENDINLATKLEPMGYVAKEMTSELVFGDPDQMDLPLHCGRCYRELDANNQCPDECE